MHPPDLLERYVVFGPETLAEPDVAAYVTANPELVHEIDAGVDALRQQMAPYRGPIPYSPRNQMAPAIPRYPRRWQRPTFWARRVIIGSVATTATVLAGWFAFGSKPAKQQLAVMSTYTTANGERSTFTLPDGTQVMLNVASTLRLASGFGGMTRTVVLEGEAQFIVQHDVERPFVVRAGRTEIRDLATTFVVRTYPETHTLVAVQDGRVRVDPPHVTPAAALHLDPGQFARVAPDGAIASGRIVNHDLYFGWTQGRLTLQRAPLAEALSELSRWYDFEFRVSNRELLTQHLSMTLGKTLTDEQLHAIADVLDARVIRDGRMITFVPKTFQTNGEH